MKWIKVDQKRLNLFYLYTQWKKIKIYNTNKFLGHLKL